MNKKYFFVILFILMSLVCIFMKIQTNIEIDRKNNEVIENNIVNEIVIEETNITVQDSIEEEPIIEPEPETYTTMYSTVGLNIRKEPNLDSEIIDTVNINTELQTVNNFENEEWTKIKIDDNYYYVASKFLSNEEVEIPKEEPRVQAVQTKTYYTSGGDGVLTKSKGVNYYNGHKETWYSQRVLPGGGLNIPGRHVDERGLVCDENGYICVASSDYSKGTIVETSLGTGKVYDCGCASGTIDIYCDW